jgi:hypothetical protein
MTHTIHRRGDRGGLEGDYVVLIQGLGQHEKSIEAVKILARHNPVGLIKRRGDSPLRYMKNWEDGLSIEELVENLESPSYISGVYVNKSELEEVVKDFVDADLGLPVTISGNIDDIFQVCENSSIGPHTVMISLETFGRTELIPDDKILEITTMCGHGLVNQHLVRHLIHEVRQRNMTSMEAALELGKQCVCNSFNHIRAKKILDEYIDTPR